jgi:hypothetical protein
MESSGQRSTLAKLSELDVPLEESWQDIYVDREARRPRYLVVSAGGLLGVGKKHFLVPVEEVSRDVGEERVTVPKEKVLNSPEFDLDVSVPAGDLQRAIEAYYGHR